MKPTATGWQARKQHVIYLYAEYVHLNWLQEVSATEQMWQPHTWLTYQLTAALRLLHEDAFRVVEALGLQVWTGPLTEKPLLEPCFAAAFHGIELCFLLLAEFVADKRKVNELITHWLWHRRIPRTSDFHKPLIFSTVMPLEILELLLPATPVSCWG